MEPDITRPSTIGNDNSPQKTPHSLLADIVLGLRYFSVLKIPFTEEKYKESGVSPDFNRMVPALGVVSLILSLGPLAVFVFLTVLGVPYLVSICFLILGQLAIAGARPEIALASFGARLFRSLTSQSHELDSSEDDAQGTFFAAITTLILLVQFVVRLFAFAAIYIGIGWGALFVFVGIQIISRQGAILLALLVSPSPELAGQPAPKKLKAVPFTVGASFAVLASLVTISGFTGWFPFLILILLIAAAAFALAKYFSMQRDLRHKWAINCAHAALEILALCIISAAI